MASAGDRLRAFGRGVAVRRILKRAADRVHQEILLTIRIQRTWRSGVVETYRSIACVGAVGKA